MSFISAFITLCLVIDPFGSIPVILSLVPHVDNQRWQYRRVILREGLVALAVLVVFLLAGNRIMQAMHISQAALSAAGGTVLFIVAIRMIFPSRTGVFGGEEQQGENDQQSRRTRQTRDAGRASVSRGCRHGLSPSRKYRKRYGQGLLLGCLYS